MEQFSFKFDAYGGLGEVRGVVQFDGQRLRLHYQVADAMFGALRSQPREVEFAPEAVIEADYRAGWFWLMPRVELQVSEIAKITDMPLETAGHLRLSIPWAQRRTARRLVEGLALAASERRYRRLDAELARMTRTGENGVANDAAAAARPPVPPPMSANERE